MWTVNDIIEATGGTTLRVEAGTFSGISTDTRTIAPGELFIPLSGNNYDGHAFIDTAYERSAAGTLCEQRRTDIIPHLKKGTVILVEDTLKALSNIAHRKRKRINALFIGITGSNGKTTTKEILVHILKGSFPVAYNEKNYNNIIGVSRGIISITGEPACCVFEIGTNAPGEIRQLASLLEPDLSLVTNINPSHLEGLRSIEEIAEEKIDLFRQTNKNGAFLWNADDPHIRAHLEDKEGFPAVRYSFAINNNADFSLGVLARHGWEGYDILLTLRGEDIRTTTELLGTHNLYNILAAASLAYCAGVDGPSVGKMVATFKPYSMRMRPVHSKKGYTIIDDSYNANPSSMEWAINTLLELPCEGKRIAIIGDMKELGEKSVHYHRELGRFLKDKNIPLVLLIGDETHAIYDILGNNHTIFFEKKGKLIEYATSKIGQGDVVLIKGSRAIKMDEIVEALT